MYCSLRAVGPEDVYRLRRVPEAATALASVATGRTVSLEKAWHGLHFLLTGSARESKGPLGFLLSGGEAFGHNDSNDEAGDRYFSPDEINRLDRALAEISDEQLWERFDPFQMADEGIYPGIWDEPEADLQDEYLTYFHAMKELIHRANVAKQGIVVSIG